MLMHMQISLACKVGLVPRLGCCVLRAAHALPKWLACASASVPEWYWTIYQFPWHHPQPVTCTGKRSRAKLSLWKEVRSCILPGPFAALHTHPSSLQTFSALPLWSWQRAQWCSCLRPQPCRNCTRCAAAKGQRSMSITRA